MVAVSVPVIILLGFVMIIIVLRLVVIVVMIIVVLLFTMIVIVIAFFAVVVMIVMAFVIAVIAMAFVLAMVVTAAHVDACDFDQFQSNAFAALGCVFEPWRHHVADPGQHVSVLDRARLGRAQLEIMGRPGAWCQARAVAGISVTMVTAAKAGVATSQVVASK